MSGNPGFVSGTETLSAYVLLPPLIRLIEKDNYLSMLQLYCIHISTAKYGTAHE